MEIRIFIPGHSSEGLLLPWVCLPFCFSYLFTSMWECLVLLVFPPTGIWVEPVGLGGSAASVTFQRGEIPANPSGKGTPVCTSEFPWNPLVLLSWELWSHTRALPWEGLSGQRSRVLLGTGAAWKTVPEWLSWDQSCSRSVDFLKRWIFPFWLELGA